MLTKNDVAYILNVLRLEQQKLQYLAEYEGESVLGERRQKMADYSKHIIEELKILLDKHVD